MINCDKFVSLITDYLDDALDEQRKAEFNEHLLACKKCAAVFQRIKTLQQHLKKLPSMKTSSAFEVVLKNRLRRELGRNTNWDWIGNPWAKVSMLGLSTAALFLVAFFSLNYFSPSKKEQQVSTNEPAMFPTFQTSTNEANAVSPTHSEIEERVFFVVEDVPAGIFASDQPHYNLLPTGFCSEKGRKPVSTNGDSIVLSSKQVGYQFHAKPLATVTF